MSRSLQLIPASSFGLAELADLYTRSFADYFYDVSVTTEELARRVPAELIDLDRSLLASVDGTIAAVALLCLEGEGACCGGFGVTVPFRGQGLATPLAMAMLDQARAAGARRLTLVVMAENERAVRSYARAGMQIWRDLITLAWQRPSGWIAPKPVEGIVELPPVQLLEHAAALHACPAIWSRSPPTLRRRTDLVGLALRDADQILAYALYRHDGGSAIELADLGAVGGEAALTLLQALQAKYAHIVCGNEPVANPLIASFQQAGFLLFRPRYEMLAEL
jgi:GNAT superfamily N-acetyltransferase